MKNIYVLAVLLFSGTAMADGSSGCPDDAVKFICECRENSRKVESYDSECIDQTARSYKRERDSFRSQCESGSNQDRDCVVTGTR